MKLLIIFLLVIVIFAHTALQGSCSKECRCKSEYKLVPLYELYLSKTATYLYLTSLREINAAVKKGCVRKGIIGLVAESHTDCKGGNSLIPISRLHNCDNTDYLYQYRRDEVHGGCNSTYGLDGIVFFGATNRKPCGATWALYRFWTGKRHILTTDYINGKKRAGNKGTYEGVVCSIWPFPTSKPTKDTTPDHNLKETEILTPKTHPTKSTTLFPSPSPGKQCAVNFGTLYQLFHHSTNSHLHTTSLDEANKANSNLKYEAEISPGLVAITSSDCRCGNSLIPVYHLKSPTDHHFYTTSDDEASDTVANLGYSHEGVAYYCALKEGLCGASIALQRFKKSNEKDVNEALENESSHSRETYEGILCYIWPN